MTDERLRIRVEELDAVADHVPPGVLGHRLLAALEDRFGGSMELVHMWARFQDLVEGEAGAEPLFSAEVERRTRAALESAERLAAERLEEIGRLQDVLRQERILAEEKASEATEAKPGPAERFDPGIPQRAEDLAMPERPEPTPVEQVEEDLRQFPEESGWRTFDPNATVGAAAPEETDPEPVEEPSKPCIRCGETKPLSEFYEKPRMKDGRANVCKECHKRRQRELQERKRAATDHRERRLRADDTKAAEQGRVEEAARRIEAAPAESSPKADSETRLCARGRMCLAYPEIGQPSPLAKRNDGDLCFRCEGARRKTTLDQVRQFPIVRHSAADQEAAS